jgi:hypothetical protein
MQFDLEKALEILSQTPKLLRVLIADRSEEWIGGGSETDWNPYDVVGHLIHGEKTDWIPRARIILAQGANRTFEKFDRLAQFEDSKGQTLAELLDEFDALRGENLMRLEAMNITPEKLKLKGIHPELGEVDLAQLLATWTVHDLNHIRQIVKFIAMKYKDAVGPWTQYLKILQ